METSIPKSTSKWTNYSNGKLRRVALHVESSAAQTTTRERSIVHNNLEGQVVSFPASSSTTTTAELRARHGHPPPPKGHIKNSAAAARLLLPPSSLSKQTVSCDRSAGGCRQVQQQPAERYQPAGLAGRDHHQRISWTPAPPRPNLQAAGGSGGGL